MNKVNDGIKEQDQGWDQGTRPGVGTMEQYQKDQDELLGYKRWVQRLYQRLGSGIRIQFRINIRIRIQGSRTRIKD